MSRKVTRREFIVSIGQATFGALLSERFCRSAIALYEEQGKPLIVPPSRPQHTLYAELDAEGYELRLEEPVDKLPILTWREYLADFCGIDRPTRKALREFEYEHGHAVTPDILDQRCPTYVYEEQWFYLFSGNACAYDYLEGLRLGEKRCSGQWEPLGGLRFLDAPSIGSNYRGVIAEDALSLGALQERLNQLGESVRIVTV